MTDTIAVVEAAYRLDLSPERWLREVLAAAGPQLLDELGGIASFFDRHAPESTSIVSHVVNVGCDPALVAALRAAFEGGTTDERDRSLRQGGPVLRLSKLAEMPLAQNPFYGPLARNIGFSDIHVLRAMNPDGTGAFFAAPIRRGTRRGGEWATRLGLLSTHLAAGLRLRRTLPKEEAVLTPGGRVLALSPSAEDGRETLRRAVIEMDRARSRRGRRDEKSALEGWRALVDGRWSLVDQFESDGKRHVIAVENTPTAPDPRALTALERPVLHYVAMGHPNKLIAYELGLPLGTVATRVLSIMRKLGVKSRVEIIDRYQALVAMEFARLGSVITGTAPVAATSETTLTRAEREVTNLVQRGLSNKQIAAARECSPRTVANQLARIFEKLGVASRAQLVTRSGVAARQLPPRP